MSGNTTGRISTQLSRGTLMIFIALVATVIASLFWATDRSDDLSVERQVRFTRHAIEVALDELALQQETVSIWDDAAKNMVAPVPDQRWLRDNMTSWLHKIFSHDAGFLIDGQDQPVQSSIRGNVVPNAHFERLRHDLTPLLLGVRGKIHGPNGRHDRNPGRALPPHSSVRTTTRTTHDTHLMLIGGRPAAASAMLIKPSTKDYVTARGDWPVLISIRYLDGDFLGELEDKHLIGSPRFSRTDERRRDEQSILLSTEGGRALGYLLWTPDLPGSRIMSVMLPTSLAVIGLLGMLMWMLTRRLNATLAERGALEARASHLAYHDPLTGLPNRTLLGERLLKALNGPHRGRVALLLIDLDRFKQVNDTLGHLAGDQLIRDFATRLTGIAGPRDTVARLGGDEFAVILIDRDWPQDTQRLAQAILDLFSTPFDLMSTRVFGGASIGAALAEGRAADATELMRRADVALYCAKAEGRGCSRIYEPAMDEGAKKRTRLESELRDALAADQLVAWHQPQVDATGAVIGRELLLRWEHPKLGLISPDQIIPVAEETGLILPIGDWVLEQAAVFARQDDGLFTAVNLSPMQLRDPDFAERVMAIFRAAGADPRRVELEITEQILIDENKAIRRSLARLRRAGFRIALDDFGTGYSSLSYLRRFSVDKIKIDRSFVVDVQRSADARAIIAAIVGLGSALRLTIAAEGVETQEQADILLAAGCDQLQGYLFGRPTPARAIEEKVAAQAA